MMELSRRKGGLPVLHEPHGLALEVIRRMVETGKRCFLCNGPPFASFAWIPDQPRTPPSRQRSYWALLCEVCVALPDGLARAEAGLKREVLVDLLSIQLRRHDG